MLDEQPALPTTTSCSSAASKLDSPCRSPLSPPLPYLISAYSRTQLDQYTLMYSAPRYCQYNTTRVVERRHPHSIESLRCRTAATRISHLSSHLFIMGREVVIDESIRDYFDTLIQQREQRAGLLLAQRSADRDFVVAVVPAAAASTASLNVDDIVEQAAAVIRALPGGIEIAGAFGVAAASLNASLMQIITSVWELYTDLDQRYASDSAAATSTEAPSPSNVRQALQQRQQCVELLVLEVNSSSRRFACTARSSRSLGRLGSLTLERPARCVHVGKRASASRWTHQSYNHEPETFSTKR